MSARAKRLLQQLGMPGAVGLALLAAALWLQHGWVPQQQAMAEAAVAEADTLRVTLRARASALSSPDAAAPRTAEAAWQALWHALPHASERMALQRALWQAAEQAGVRTPGLQMQGEQESWVPASPAGGLWRQRVSIPAEAEYPALRDWLARLQTVPGLGIDAIELQRTDASQPLLKAQVKVSLWWRTPGGAR